jgi:hypothetical protein
MTRTRKLLLAIVALSLPLVVVPSVDSSADPFGWEPGGTGLLADSRDHWYCTTSSVSAGSRHYYVEAMAYLDDRTVMSDHDSGSSCTSLTDVVFIIDNTWGSLGQTMCVAPVSPGSLRCEQMWIIVNDTAHFQITATCNDTPDEMMVNYMMTVRHEIGHTTGLSHTSANGGSLCGPPYNGNDTMTSDWVTAGAPLTFITYNDHHKNHIDGFY